jgi:hypothetical protein
VKDAAVPIKAVPHRLFDLAVFRDHKFKSMHHLLLQFLPAILKKKYNFILSSHNYAAFVLQLTMLTDIYSSNNKTK